MSLHRPVHPGVCEPRSGLELSDIVREHAGELEALHPALRRVLAAIESCRTASLGGHVYECDCCGRQKIAYNSCRNRHCPKCQGLEEAEWVEARCRDLLPVDYFHVVFTHSHVLNELFLAHPKLCYGLLFSAVSETLQEVAANSEHLGARIGFTQVLHTWTQTLLFHPHVHCIVPGGGLSADGCHWVGAKPRFFLPVRVLAQVFRGKLLSKLEAAVEAGKFSSSFEKPAALARLKQSAETEWVVYAKPPFSGPEQVLEYLGRYTHRIAISNPRLVSLVDGVVTFRYKDRAHGNRTRTMSLPAKEFLRRFLLHVLPKGLVRIRYCGLFANAVRQKNLARCRELLRAPTPAEPNRSQDETWQQRLLRLTGVDVTVCVHCSSGHLHVVSTLPPRSDLRSPSARASPT